MNLETEKERISKLKFPNIIYKDTVDILSELGYTKEEIKNKMPVDYLSPSDY